MIIEPVNPPLVLEPSIPETFPVEVAAFIKGDKGDSGPAGDPYNLLTWAYSQTFRVISATRDANGAIVTASIAWPDGLTGVFTTDVASTAFPGAIDAWHATYNSNPIKYIAQAAVTRDASGGVIAQPALTIV